MSRFEPVAWNPPPPPNLDGAYEENLALAAAERWTT